MPTRKTFIEEQQQHGHYKTERAILTAALVEAWLRADLVNRATLFSQILAESERYAREVLGWSDVAARNLRGSIAASLRTTARGSPLAQTFVMHDGRPIL